MGWCGGGGGPGRWRSGGGGATCGRGGGGGNAGGRGGVSRCDGGGEATGGALWRSLGWGPGGRSAGVLGRSGCRRSRRNSSRSFMGSSVPGDRSPRVGPAAG